MTADEPLAAELIGYLKKVLGEYLYFCIVLAPSLCTRAKEYMCPAVANRTSTTCPSNVGITHHPTHTYYASRTMYNSPLPQRRPSRLPIPPTHHPLPDALEIRNGPGHAEVKMCRGTPVLVEVGARCHGGEGVWVPVVDLVVG